MGKLPASLPSFFFSFTEKGLRFYYLLIAALVFLAYGNTLFNGYSLDDNLVTDHNPLVEQGLKALPEIFTTNYISEENLHLDYRPLVKASYAIEHTFFGWNPGFSHFINVLLYALACCLLLKVLLEVFGREYFAVLFTGVLLYAVHPVHTEVVASLKNRDEIFVLLFASLSALWFLKWSTEAVTKYFVFGIAFFLLALFSKISALPFVASIPLLVFIKRNDWKKAAMVFGALALVAGAFYAVVISTLPGFARPYEFVETPFPFINDWNTKLGTAMYSLWWYIKLLVVPHPLSFYYGFGYVELKTLASVLPIISLLLHIAILAVGVWSFNKNRFVFFLSFFYLIQISLYANIVLPLAGMVAERALLFASLSFCLLIAYLVFKVLKPDAVDEKTIGKKTPNTYTVNFTGSKFGLLAALLLVYTATAFARNLAWKDVITLFEADMPHLQTSAKANYIIAKEIRRVYRLDKQLTPEKHKQESAKAIQYYTQAIVAHPGYAMAMEELGMIYAVELKQVDKAIPLFEKAFAIDSQMWRSAYNLGMSYQLSADTMKAITWYEKTIQVHPESPKALVELAKLYYITGEKPKALEANERLMKLNPESPLPYYNAAIYYMMEKDTLKAVTYFEEDVKRGEKEQFPYYFLYLHYLGKGDTVAARSIKDVARRIGKGN